MLKTWGIAQFNGVGSMQYLLESGEWLADRQLFDGAPILLFASMEDADAHAAQLKKSKQAHGVQFMVDQQGKVITARRNK